MTAISDFQSQLDSTIELENGLAYCFNALSAQAFDDARLKAVVHSTLAENGLSSALPLQHILNALEPVHTGLIVAEARGLTDSAEAAQRRVRLLCKSARAIYCAPDDQSDAAFSTIAPTLAAEIREMHELYVPYAYHTAGHFLTGAASYPSFRNFKNDAATIEARRSGISIEFERQVTGMDIGTMTAAQLDAFYAPYTDMSAHPRQDYADNTDDLMAHHIDIAKTSLARLGLRMTQAYLILQDTDALTALSTDRIVQEDFKTKFLETKNGFQRPALHLRGGEMNSGTIQGAAQLLTCRAAYTI